MSCDCCYISFSSLKTLKIKLSSRNVFNNYTLRFVRSFLSSCVTCCRCVCPARGSAARFTVSGSTDAPAVCVRAWTGACPRRRKRTSACWWSFRDAVVSTRRRMKSTGPSCDQIIDPRWSARLIPGRLREATISAINQSITVIDHTWCKTPRGLEREPQRETISWPEDGASGLKLRVLDRTGFWIMWLTSDRLDPCWRRETRRWSR